MSIKNKKPLYLIPGLAANENIFHRFRFPEDQFKVKILNWFSPISIHESIDEYTEKMAQKITEPSPILVGVSFGGVIAQEIARIINTRHVFIISSIKSNTEIPTLYKFFTRCKLYHLIPFKLIEKYEQVLLKKGSLRKQFLIKAYQNYLPIREPLYIRWVLKHMFSWKPKTALKNLTHIHGKYDNILPIKRIKNSIVIENGNHAIILLKTDKIQELILAKIV